MVLAGVEPRLSLRSRCALVGGSMDLRALCAAGLAASLWLPRPALADCKLAAIDIPVTMVGRRLLVTAKLNGQDEKFVIDSGAFANAVSARAAKADKLQPVKIESTGSRVMTDGVSDVWGVGGDTASVLVTAATFEIAGGKFSKVPFLTFPALGDEAGLIGQNFLHVMDVEYDVSHDKMRLVQPEGCEHVNMAYWATDGNVSEVPLLDSDEDNRNTSAMIEVNGVKMRATFDTGAETSFITRGAAARAGVKVTDAGVRAATDSRGVDGRPVKTWAARFAKVKVGGEEISNGWLSIGDTSMDDTDILIGADFFLAHRIYVANSQNQLYFSYVGGKVFDVGAAPEPVAAGDKTPKPAAK